jgi:hypothetical protein
MYGSASIQPIMSGLWIGQPGNPAETGGGPFVYLFSGPVTCANISAASGWLPTLPTGTQVLEMLIGTTTPNVAVTAASAAAAGAVETNWALAGTTGEHRATSGTVTLTTYTAGDSLSGSINVTFPAGTATGTFNAKWCPTGKEF